MSLANVRGSVNKRLDAVREVAIPLLTELYDVWEDACYRVEWGGAEVPRSRAWYARNLRIHVRGRATFDVEKRVEKILAGLGLPANNDGIAVLDELDFETDPAAASPAKVGVILLERAMPRAVDVVPVQVEDPQVVHHVLNLVAVYRRR